MYGWTRVSNSTEASLSPTQRAWLRFRHNRLGFYSLVLFVFFFGLSLLAEVLCNDKPLLARYNGSFYMPIVHNQPETAFGGDFDTPTDYADMPAEWTRTVVMCLAAELCNMFGVPTDRAADVVGRANAMRENLLGWDNDEYSIRLQPDYRTGYPFG